MIIAIAAQFSILLNANILSTNLQVIVRILLLIRRDVQLFLLLLGSWQLEVTHPDVRNDGKPLLRGVATVRPLTSISLKVEMNTDMILQCIMIGKGLATVRPRAGIVFDLMQTAHMSLVPSDWNHLSTIVDGTLSCRLMAELLVGKQILPIL